LGDPADQQQSPVTGKGRIRLRQFPVFNPVWLIGFNAQSPLTIRFVIGVVALEPDDLRIALKRQNMRGDAIQEPAVMGNNHRATGEGQQGFFQRPQVSTSRSLVGSSSSSTLPPLFKQLGQMNPVALAAG
jgi:hypothetical protein